MKAALAERLLAEVMERSPEDVASERPVLQVLADRKYDAYQQFSPGMRLVESLALWLGQFKDLDIIDAETSKLAVVQRLAELVSPRIVLCIGDRGGWPGNDFELLGHRFALSVDDVSSAPRSCWNLAPRACLGPSATIRYLAALQSRSGSLRINLAVIEGSGARV